VPTPGLGGAGVGPEAADEAGGEPRRGRRRRTGSGASRGGGGRGGAGGGCGWRLQETERDGLRKVREKIMLRRGLK
jgi:hypothetical protein